MILRHFVIRASSEPEKENKYIKRFNRGKIADWELVKVKTESETKIMWRNMKRMKG